jgi:riboflavin kinase/FMN adenylyltransferase
VSQEGTGPELTPPVWKGRKWDEIQRRTPSIVALGNFDGVHLGHRRILETLLFESRATGLDPVIVTFEPHPRYYFKPQEKPSLLTTPGEKLQLLKHWPVEVALLTFDQALAELEPEDFIQVFLKERIQGVRFLLGHDHRFGKRARGDVSMLRAHATHPDQDVIMLEPFRLDGEVVSSSAIRSHLESSRIEKANRLLGRPFTYAGKVVRGAGRGRTLGFPTANLELGYPYKAMVEFGVYGGRARTAAGVFDAIANIGTTPTFPGQNQKIEVHILDHAADLYDQWLEFELHFHVRPEKKFTSQVDLVQQINLDLTETRQRLRALTV